ncbi:amidase family protein, partial [Chlamydiota bacterium]
KEYDILLSPVAATPAKLHGKTFEEGKDLAHCLMHSLTGWPVTVVRCGTSSQGLPIGVQIAAKSWNDHLSLALGAHLQKQWQGWQASPLF